MCCLGREETPAFRPEAITTPTMTNYREYLQQTLGLKPNSVNRTLISLKRYFTWLLSTGHLKHDPAKVVKLVDEEVLAPRHLDDQEEQALVAAVTESGSLRDRAIVILWLHTGLRARELCTLTRAHVRLGKRSGTVVVRGKRNKYCIVLHPRHPVSPHRALASKLRNNWNHDGTTRLRNKHRRSRRSP